MSNRGKYDDAPRCNASYDVIKAWAARHDLLKAGKEDCGGVCREGVYPDLRNPWILENGKYSERYLHSKTLLLRDISHYSISDFSLGRGAYGEVIRAELENGEKVAIKKTTELDSIPSADQLIEISTLIHLSHPNIVSILDLLDMNKRSEDPVKQSVGIVMPLAIGDLGSRKTAKYFKVDDKTTKQVAFQFLSGLSYLHSLHIIHRDLKPQNLLLFDDGSVKIADFGSAKHYACFPRPDWTDEVTTRWYRAPEMILTQEIPGVHGTEIDVWSAGVIVFEFFASTYDAEKQLYMPMPFANGRDELHQIVMYREAIGPVDGGFTSRIKNTRPSLRILFTKATIPNLYLRLSAHPEIAGLCMGMLRWSPEDRPTIYETLQDTYWDDVRDDNLVYPMLKCTNAIRKRDRRLLVSSWKLIDVPREKVDSIIFEVYNTATALRLPERTILRAICYLDEVLPLLFKRAPFDIQVYRLAMAACLNISQNLHDTYHLDDDEFVSDLKTVSKVEFYRMKQNIVKILNYDFVITISLDYEHEFDFSDNEEKNVWAAFVVMAYLDGTLRYAMQPYDLAITVYEFIRNQRLTKTSMDVRAVFLAFSDQEDGFQAIIKQYMISSSWLVEVLGEGDVW